MKQYSNFNEMFGANSNTNHSIFNSIKEDSATGCFDVIVFGSYPYLSVYYYNDEDVRSDDLPNDRFSGVEFTHTSNLNDYIDGDDLVETLFSVICESTDRTVLDDSANDSIDFDYPLSRDEALKLASKLDTYVELFIKKHSSTI
jgi:hypothetical protein